MISLRAASWCLLGIALGAGTFSDAARRNPPVVLGGYRVLQADFHVHAFPLSASTLAPWDLVLEAQRQGLDAIAITPHNSLGGTSGRWFARLIGGPTVLAGEEIHAPGYHLIALGIARTISWRLSAATALDEVHRQGGFAIAAHPVARFQRAFDAEAMEKLDGTEVMQPIAYSRDNFARELQEFYARRRLTAIGSSDYHGAGPLGLCRTYVFARENTERGILEALRAGRTVVYDRDGRAHGDAELMGLVRPPVEARDGFLVVLSRSCGVLGMMGAIIAGFRRVRSYK